MICDVLFPPWNFFFGKIGIWGRGCKITRGLIENSDQNWAKTADGDTKLFIDNRKNYFSVETSFGSKKHTFKTSNVRP